MNSQPAPDLLTRLLHLGLAVGVTLQLLLSAVMERPRPGAARPEFELAAFEAHEFLGLASLVLILAWFLWLFLRRREPGPRDLYPWFSAAQRSELTGTVRRALAEVRRGRMPAEPDNRLVARTVHGLGALCALSLALSGAAIWLGLSDDGALVAWARPVMEFHEVVANLMWAYVLGHAAMAVMHHRRGEATLRRMFSLRRLQSPVID